MARRNSWSSAGAIRTIRRRSRVARESRSCRFQKIATTTIRSQCGGTFPRARFSAGVDSLQNCWRQRKICRVQESRRLLVSLRFQSTAPGLASSQARRKNSEYGFQIRRLQVRSMRVLHLNTHTSGGSYEYARLLSTALAEQGIESQVLCKDSLSAESGRPLIDRIIRRSYVSFSTEPWHGTLRLLCPPAAE